MNEPIVVHYGVKGMRWGVRKADPDLTISTPGIKVGRDGSINISKGASLQRLVRSNGQSLPMKDLTYASINDYDNARYIKTIGGKGFFGGGRDQILSIKATKPIKAPSENEATKLHSDLMLRSSEFRKKNTSMLAEPISAKELEQIRKDPTGKTAKAWYYMANVKMTFGKDFDPDAPYVQNVMSKALQEKGFNALRDENDFTTGLAKAPIIIFNPQDSLKVTKVTDITDDLRKSNKQQLKQYKAQGKNWVDEQLYRD